MKYGFVIAGTHSGAGKTTTVLTLLAALHDKAMIVQPFKVGPDYLDPGYHNLFSGGRKSRNLDSFLLSEDYIRTSFRRNMHRADVAVVEGVMGMFDGKGAESELGSTVHVSKILGLPIVLVVDAKGLARSAGAFVLGFKTFDPASNLKGVLFNHVAGPKHFEYLKRSVSPDWKVPVLGYIPEDKDIHIPERHLGLTSALENLLPHAFFDHLKKAAQFIDTDCLLELAQMDDSMDFVSESDSLLISPDLVREDLHALKYAGSAEEKRKARIGIAYDEAFSFYYEDNFDLLRDAGAELVFFSPLYGHALPEDIDALYLGGGFPELFAPKLSRNLSMIENIQKFAAEGHFIYAECGGLIYLSESFKDKDGKTFKLVGIVPGQVEMTDTLQSFGYKEMVTATDTFLFGMNEQLKSHEFHFSRWTTPRKDFEMPYKIEDHADGFWSFPVLASYQHLHFGSHPSLAARFVESILDGRFAVKSP